MTADGEPPPSGARSRVRSLVLARPLLGSTLAVAAVTPIARFNDGVREVLIDREFGTPESLAVLADLPGVSLAWDEGPGRVYAVDPEAVDAAVARLDAATLSAAGG